MAYYYVDYTNGNNARTGLRIPAGAHDSGSYNTIDSSADTTHFVDSALGGYATSALVGSFFYNVTRAAGALITANTTTTGAVTLGTAIGSMAAGDSYYILDSYQTINAFTGVSRSAGDVGYARANMTHTQGAANITCSSNGTNAAKISLIGCNVTQGIDPWVDNSDTKPVLDFNNQAYYFSQGSYFWSFKNLDIRYCNRSGSGMMHFSSTACIDVTNCTFRDGVHATGYCVSISNSSEITFTNCAFLNTANILLYPSACSGIYFDSCSFNSGANNTAHAIFALSCWGVYLYNCTFGATNTFATSCIRWTAGSMGVLFLKKCVFTLGSAVKIITTVMAYNSAVYEEDAEGTLGNHLTTLPTGIIQKCASGLTDTTVRSGGASSSARIIPNTYCGIKRPIQLAGDPFFPNFKVWCPASATTVAIYMRAYGTWGTYPTASELYIQAEYYSSSSPITKSLSTASTQVLSDGTTWVSFTTTFTPVVAGWAYIKLSLGKYQDASTGIYVDVRPVIS